MPTPTLSVKISPLGDRVVILPTPADEVTPGGLVLPDISQKKPQQGTVIALGNGGIGKDCVNPNDYLSVGDEVLVPRYAGDEVKLKDADGKDVEVRIFKIESILGKIIQ